jgi:hypothetical protein
MASLYNSDDPVPTKIFLATNSRLKLKAIAKEQGQTLTQLINGIFDVFLKEHDSGNSKTIDG